MSDPPLYNLLFSWLGEELLLNGSHQGVGYEGSGHQASEGVEGGVV